MFVVIYQRPRTDLMDVIGYSADSLSQFAPVSMNLHPSQSICAGFLDDLNLVHLALLYASLTKNKPQPVFSSQDGGNKSCSNPSHKLKLAKGEIETAKQKWLSCPH